MKNVKKLCAGVTLGVLLSMVTVNAAGTWTSASFINIPGWSGTKVDMAHGNTKKTWENRFSVHPSKITAYLGNAMRLINGNQDGRSQWVAIYQDVPMSPASHQNDVGATYYSQVRSDNIEFGNNNDVYLKFSADPM